MSSEYDELTVRFKALAHPGRLQILDLLRHGEVCVCHIEAVIGRRQAYVSQQLMALREAGLVESRQEGLRVFYRLADDLAVDLLDVALGPATGEHARVDGCPCPACEGSA
jgi:DNA-binding transcriptional ArsR family regulator